MDNLLLFYYLYLISMFSMGNRREKGKYLYYKYEHKPHIPNSSMRNPWNQTLFSDIHIELLPV